MFINAPTNIEIIDMRMSFMGISGRVVGIMEDFHFSSLRNNIEPLAIVPVGSEYLSNMIVRLKPGSVEHTMEQIEENMKIASEFSPLSDQEMQALEFKTLPIVRQGLYFRRWNLGA